MLFPVYINMNEQEIKLGLQHTILEATNQFIVFPDKIQANYGMMLLPFAYHKGDKAVPMALRVLSETRAIP